MREFFGLFLIFCALLLLLGLLSFDAADPSINFVKSGTAEVKNMAGVFGAYAAGLLNDFFGVGALLWPCVFAALGAAHVFVGFALRWWRWCGFFLLTLCLLTAASSLDFSVGDLEGGGMVGNAMLAWSVRYLSLPGAFLLWLFVFLAGLQLSANFSWISLGKLVATRFQECFSACRSNRGAESESPVKKLADLCKRAGKAAKSRASALAEKFAASPLAKTGRPPLAIEIASRPELAPQPQDDDPFAPAQVLKREEMPADHAPAAEAAAQGRIESVPPLEEAPENSAAVPDPAPPIPAPAREEKPPIRQERDLRLFKEKKDFVLPPVELLRPPQPAAAASPKELEEKGRVLMACFNDFDIQGELARITPGPVVTMFEVRPAPGIRVSKIANLSDDLSLALKAVAVRIQAPIPGTDTVGIEIPNEKRELVNFRELVESAAFSKAGGALTMVLGKDIAGHPFMADLAKMPHMLVAGATGAGKSVCLNAILISLLYRMPPDRLKLLLVDPKRIEMAVYADLPHLVHPVVTEMEDATNALAWAVSEMENRFKIFMRLGVRNIAAYHEKLASYSNNPPENLADLEPLPYMVIVIDELADLMLTAAREVEGKIQRLAQLARAAGIHMILATQRPSVDVVTGLIKAQFPCRISFQVSSRHDSRTILDEMGAEHLLGRGDMLFKPPGCRLMRLHGPFLSDGEVQDVVNHWKAQQAPDYQVDFSQWGQEADAAANQVGGDASSDSLYDEARNFVLEQSKPSISLLQRHLRIGYNRAARLMEHFRAEGIVGADVGKTREAGR